jgi:hypothetical protein
VVGQSITLAGHALTLSAGCHVRQGEESGSIQCAPTDSSAPGWASQASASWVFVPDEKRAKEMVSAKRKIFAEPFRPDAPRADEDDVPCRLAGRQTVCRVQVHSKEKMLEYFRDHGQQVDEGDFLDATLRTRVCMTAYVQVEGKVLVGWCLSDGSSGERVPCTSLFEMGGGRTP